MKTVVLKLILTVVLISLSSVSFAQQNKKIERARKGVIQAQKKLNQAKIDSTEDFLKFKKRAEMRIVENRAKIDALKKKKAHKNKESNARYQKKVLALERKNNELQKRIEGSNYTKNNKWTLFKQKFDKDLEKLGGAIKETGSYNIKQ